MNYKRLGLLIFLYFLWIKSQTLLSSNIVSKNEIIDQIHKSELVENIIDYLEKNIHIARFHIALTTFLIDITLIIIILKSIWLNDYKFPIIYIIGIILRQICQFINQLPIPNRMIWFDPGIPTIFMVYVTENDFFFSGHTLTGISIGIELIEQNNILTKIYGIFFMIYQIIFVLITRCHYFMDVYAAIATYFMVKYFYSTYLTKYL